MDLRQKKDREETEVSAGAAGGGDVCVRGLGVTVGPLCQLLLWE